MVAIVSGNGLGLFNTSFNTLGEAGVSGARSGLGQAGGSAFVNAATGNLVLQFTDEQLSGLGEDLHHLRTYNSQGAIADDDADGWRWQGERRLALTGMRNVAGSFVARTLGDGHQTVHVWDGSAYTATEGDGAHDTIVWNADISRWTWTDGSTRAVEHYLDTSGRLSERVDADGTALTFSYNASGRLGSVRDSSGQELVLNYNAAGKLERLDTRTTSGGALTRQVYYAYDAAGRLRTVSADLTPSGNSITDGKIYATTYAYDGSSLRIAGISQSDGTSVEYGYQLVGNEYRVSSVMDASGTSVFSYDLTNRRTDVTNGLGQQWSFFHDAEGRLVQQLSPAKDGQRVSTRYAYDADGNLIRMSNGQDQDVEYSYDGKGNRISERDALGGLLTRLFSETHQLLSQTRHDASAARTVTQRFIYDNRDRLRFTVDETGRVAERRYNASGLCVQEIVYLKEVVNVDELLPTDLLTEKQLIEWVAGQDRAQVQLTDIVHDYRGNRSKTITYATVSSAGAGVLDAAATVTELIWSEHGQLLQTIALRGGSRTLKAVQSANGYDGQGRLVSRMDASGTQTLAYNGAKRQITLTNSAGLSKVQSFDARGRLVGETASGSDGYSAITTRTTLYVHDAIGRLAMTQDATGVRAYTFHDEAGRVSARVDGTGAMTEYVYNSASQLIREHRYAILTSTAGWFNGNSVTKTLVSEIRPPASESDRVLKHAYDAAGRRTESTDEAGMVTRSTYSADGLLLQIRKGERVERYFHDAAGRQLARLDAEGYLSENVYNAGGQLVQVIRYAIATARDQRASGSLEQLRPSAANALTTWYYYDAAGRQIGSVDEQQFVTETVFDDALNTRQTIRYAVPYTQGITHQTTFATLKDIVSSPARQVVTVANDSLGRVAQITANDGTITAFDYDAAGRLVKETFAKGSTEERSLRMRHDAFDQVVGKLLGEASARVTASTTATQLASIYAQYGLAYGYDAAGRAASITDANGNKTVSYYDEAGRLTHVVNALGEVSETVYSAFGEALERTSFSERLSNPASLAGGLNLPVKPLVQAIRNVSRDSSTVHEYNASGLMTSLTDPMGWRTRMSYTIQGDLAVVSRSLDAGAATIERFSHNLRSELLSRTEGMGDLERRTATQHDAFGRVVSTTDDRGTVSRISYELSGRKIVAHDPLQSVSSTEHDAWGRTFRETDALGNVTTYAYDDSTRKLTVTYPDGARVITEKNRHGDVYKVTDSRGYTTTYNYTRDGKLDTVVDALGQTTSDDTYDDAGNRISSKNALNQITSFTYDAADRLVTRTDANGIVTEYRFDGMGRQTDVIEARNLAEQRTTSHAYDRKGQVVSVTQDAGGLNLTTHYQYDGNGQQVLVIRGTTDFPDQQITRYTYDGLGRRITEQLDPHGLDITTQYRYNRNDQLTRKIDASGNSTWYVHDAAGRLTDTIDALGGVTRKTYDSAGRVVATTRYFTALSPSTLAGFGDEVTNVSPMADATRDQVTTCGYDDLGRLIWTQDNVTNLRETFTYDLAGNRKTLTNKAGAVWTYHHDALGRLTEEVSPAVNVQNSADAVSASRNLVTRIGYDAAGNVISRTEGILRDPSGSKADDTSQSRTMTYAYDSVGRQIRTTQAGWYNKTTGQFQQAAGTSTNTFQVTTEVTYDAVGNAVRNRIRVNNTGTVASDFVDSYKVYDAVGQVRYEIDALGSIVENGYDSIGQVATIKRYAQGIGSAPAPNSPYFRLSDMPSRITADPANDRTLTLTYDAAGRKIALQQNLISTYTHAGGLQQAAPTVVYSWNALGQLVRETLIGRDANGATVVIGPGTLNHYDALGRQVARVDALGYLTRFEYNALGQLSRQIEYATALTRWTEDSQPLPPDAHANDRSTAYEYDQLGRSTRIIQENVRYFTQTGSATIGGNLGASLISSGSLDVSTTAYDSLGNVQSRTDALGNVTSTDYDALGRVIRIKEPERAAARSGVSDPFGIAQVIASPVITMALNAFGQIVKQTRMAGSDGRHVQAGQNQVSKSTYDAAGHEIQHIDAGGSAVNFKIDAQGRRLEESRQVNVSWSELTDANGNGYADDKATQKGYSHTIRRSFEYDKSGQQLATSDWYQTSSYTPLRTRSSQVFNRFGEVTGQYLNDKLIAGFAYDQAGRKIQQTGAQGMVDMAFDIAGNLTRTTQAGDATTTADDRVTTMSYDLMGRVVVQRLPAFMANTQANTLVLPSGAVDFDPAPDAWLARITPTITLTHDRWGNTTSQTDARGKVTTYTYDHGNRVLTETLPETDILRENGTSYRASLIHERRHDALGRLIQEVDLVGPHAGMSATTELRKRQHAYNAVGQQTADVDAIFTLTNGADGNVRSYAVDANGNRLGTKDTLGTVLVDSHDAMGRQLTHGILRDGVQTVLQTNLYDQAGRLYAEISGSTAIEETLKAVGVTGTTWDSTTTGVAGNTRYTVFDERSNIVRTRNESKVEKLYEFDINNRKTQERDGLGKTRTWTYSATVGYEQLVTRKDLDGRNIAYDYNDFGQIMAEISFIAGRESRRVYSHHLNGLVESISDRVITRSSTASTTSTHIDEKSSEYQYDASGNRVRAIDGSRVYTEVVSSNGATGTDQHQRTSTETRYRFDEKNRLVGLYVPDGGMVAIGIALASGTYSAFEGARVDELTYRYDETGNRRQIVLDTRTMGGTHTRQSTLYAFDANDRVRVIDGFINADGRIVAGRAGSTNQGTALSYDRVGRRAGSEEWVDDFVDMKTGKVAGHRFSEAVYRYDDLGQLIAIRQRFNARIGSDTHGQKTNVVYHANPFSPAVTEHAEGAQIEILLNSYDGRGNKVTEIENDDKGLRKSRNDYSFRGDGQAHQQITYKYNSSRQVYDKLQASYFNENGMLDAAGRQMGYRYVVFKTNSSGVSSYQYRGHYVKTYAAFDEYKEATSKAVWIDKSGSPGTSTLTYSERGDLQQVKLTGGTAYTRFYATNREGLITMRHQADKSNSDTYLYFQGAALVHLGVPKKPELLDTFTPVSSSYPAAVPTSYVVSEGDSLQGISQIVWGDPRMWYLIADANGLEGTEALVSGDTLKIPNVVTGTHNSSETFKPYNPADVIGNTTPTPKPPESKCNAVASIVMVVVAVAASFLAGPLGTILASQLLGGGAAAMIGSAASQLAGKAMGVVDGFSLRQMVASGISGGLAAGVSNALTTTASSANAVSGVSQFAAISQGAARLTALGQGVQGFSAVAASYLANTVTGQDASLSWASIAAGFTTGYAQGKAGFGQMLSASNGQPTISGFSHAFTQVVLNSTLSSSIGRVFGVSGKQNWNMIAADAFGNALGNFFSGGMLSVEKRSNIFEKEDFVAERNKQIGAVLSEGVYDPAFKGALGFEEVDVDTLIDKGIDQKLLNDQDSGYHAKIFKNHDTDEFAVAFRGTEPASGKDWLTDFRQSIGLETSQYTIAMTLAQQLNQALGNNANIFYTGHSLGGGLASSAAVVTNGSAVTFNAAGLSSRTIERFIGMESDVSRHDVKSYYVVGDIVSLIQDLTPLPDAVGRRIDLMPTLSGLVMSPVGLHLMSNVKSSMNSR